MNKRQLEKNRDYWKEMAITFIIGTLMFAALIIFVGYDSFDHGYSHGVNDTLNNYTCTPKVFDTWSCPMLLEQGNYSFKEGILTSPSGIKLNCNKLK